MSAERTVKALLADAARPAEYKAARLAWVTKRMAELRTAQRKADEAWGRMFAALPDDLSEEQLEALPTPPEQAERDAIWREMRAVVEQDRWPREMYFGGI